MEKKLNGIAFYDNEFNGKTPIVFIHGFPFNHTMWDPQLKALSKSHRVIAYDIRGHGHSEAGDGQYTVELFVDDLMMIMDHLKIDRAILCGLSLGGYIALRAVERHADRFQGLILCDTKSEADNNEAKIKRASAIRAIKKDGVGQFADDFIKTVLCENTLEKKPELAGFLLKIIRENSSLGISGTLLALAARTDTTNALAKIILPTLLLVGEHDKLTPPSVSESMLKCLPQAAMHVIPEAAHVSNLENPSAFNDKLLTFLKRFGI